MIIRAKRQSGFTIISNVGLEDPRLGFRAKGLLAYLMSKPDNWQVRDRQLATVGPDGRAAVAAALKELAEFGYLIRKREHQANGQWEYVSYVYDEPQAVGSDAEPRLENQATVDAPGLGKPWLEKPATEKPATENRAITSTVSVSTERTSTERNKREKPAAATPDIEIVTEVERHPTPQQELFAAVAEAVGWDLQTLSTRDRGQLAQTVGMLAKAGYTVADVGRFMVEVWFRDWRWEKNNSHPTLNQLRQEIGKLRSTLKDHAPLPGGAGRSVTAHNIAVMNQLRQKYQEEANGQRD